MRRTTRNPSEPPSLTSIHKSATGCRSVQVDIGRGRRTSRNRQNLCFCRRGTPSCSPQAAASPAKILERLVISRLPGEGRGAGARDELHADRLAVEMERVDRCAAAFGESTIAPRMNAASARRSAAPFLARLSNPLLPSPGILQARAHRFRLGGDDRVPVCLFPRAAGDAAAASCASSWRVTFRDRPCRRDRTQTRAAGLFHIRRRCCRAAPIRASTPRGSAHPCSSCRTRGSSASSDRRRCNRASLRAPLQGSRDRRLVSTDALEVKRRVDDAYGQQRMTTSADGKSPCADQLAAATGLLPGHQGAIQDAWIGVGRGAHQRRVHEYIGRIGACEQIGPCRALRDELCAVGDLD